MLKKYYVLGGVVVIKFSKVHRCILNFYNIQIDLGSLVLTAYFPVDVC